MIQNHKDYDFPCKPVPAWRILIKCAFQYISLLPRISLYRPGTTPLDSPNTCTEYVRSYKHRKELNRHIRSVHALVTYTCAKCLRSYIQQYNFIKHLNRDCIAKIGSAPVINIQTVLEYQQGCMIPKYPMPSTMLRYTEAEEQSTKPVLP